MWENSPQPPAGDQTGAVLGAVCQPPTFLCQQKGPQEAQARQCECRVPFLALVPSGADAEVHLVYVLLPAPLYHPAPVSASASSSTSFYLPDPSPYPPILQIGLSAFPSLTLSQIPPRMLQGEGQVF